MELTNKALAVKFIYLLSQYFVQHLYHTRYNIMLICWDEQPQKRPTFSKLRSKFDAMLLANREEDYIDLHIDHKQPYYQQFFGLTKRVSHSGSSAASFSEDHGGADCVDKKKESISQGDFVNEMYLSANGTGNKSRQLHFRNSDQCLSSANRDSTDNNSSSRTYQNAGRPVSMYISHDKNDNQNPYVDEPSSLTPTSLALPHSIEWLPQWSTEGAMEMNQFGCPAEQVNSEHDHPRIQIHITEN